jgi:hypothetical protein
VAATLVALPVGWHLAGGSPAATPASGVIAVGPASGLVPIATPAGTAPPGAVASRTATGRHTARSPKVAPPARRPTAATTNKPVGAATVKAAAAHDAAVASTVATLKARARAAMQVDGGSARAQVELPTPTNEPVGTYGGFSPTTGSLQITQSGVYQNLSVHGHIDVLAPDVLLDNVKVDGAGSDYAIRNQSGGRLWIGHCDLGPDTRTAPVEAAVVDGDYTLDHCDVHGTVLGLHADGRTFVLSSWIHDLYAPTGTQSAGIRVEESDRTLIQNTVIRVRAADESGGPVLGRADVLVQSDEGPINDVVLQGNQLEGYVHFLVSVGAGSSSAQSWPAPTNVTIDGNTFGPAAGDGTTDGYTQGPLDIRDSDVLVTGNGPGATQPPTAGSPTPDPTTVPTTDPPSTTPSTTPPAPTEEPTSATPAPTSAPPSSPRPPSPSTSPGPSASRSASPPAPSATTPAPSSIPPSIPPSSGMRETVVPNGSYSAAQIERLIRPGPGWQVIRAASVGGVTVTDHLVLQSVSRVVLAGMHFLQGVQAGNMSGTQNPVDQVVFWYDDIEDRYSGQGSSGGPESHAVDVNPGSTNVYVVGSDVHNSFGDALRNDGGDLHVIGVRQWDAQLVRPDHLDGLQDTAGSVEIKSSLFGVPRGTSPSAYRSFDPATAGGNLLFPGPAESGHVGQSNIIIKGDFNNVTADLDQLWIANVAGRFPLDIRPATGNASARIGTVRIWATDPNNTPVVTPGASISGANNVITSAPAAGDVAPDVAWHVAYPFSDLTRWLSGTGLARVQPAASSSFASRSVTEPTPALPEAPVAILLPLAGLAGLGLYAGARRIRRKRCS